MPRSPWENGYIGGFNGKLRDEPLDREPFDALWEVKMLVALWAGRLQPDSPVPETIALHCGWYNQRAGQPGPLVLTKVPDKLLLDKLPPFPEHRK